MNAVDPAMLLHIEAVWDDVIGDKILLADEVSSPTSTEPFFFDAPASRTPSPVRTKRSNRKRTRQQSWAIANQLAHGNVEPTDAPCAEEIPWSDLVFWLGNDSTGEVECACSTCVFQRSRGRVPLVGPEHHAHAQMYVASSVYRRLSAKIPVVAMPRIEGVN